MITVKFMVRLFISFHSNSQWKSYFINMVHWPWLKKKILIRSLFIETKNCHNIIHSCHHLIITKLFFFFQFQVHTNRFQILHSVDELFDLKNQYFIDKIYTRWSSITARNDLQRPQCSIRMCFQILHTILWRINAVSLHRMQFDRFSMKKKNNNLAVMFIDTITVECR